MTREELLARAQQFEDPFVEHKSSPDRSEVVPAVVAFANSVPIGREAVLYLGIRPDGKVVGVDNPDTLQRKISDWLEETYPPVAVRYEVLVGLGDRAILAVVVSASQERPHFAGPAWIRNGSKTVKAPPSVYEDLIASRNTEAGAILAHKSETVTVAFEENWPGSWNAPAKKFIAREVDCRIEGCSAHSVQLYEIGLSQNLSIPLSRVVITTDPKRHRPLMLTIRSD